MSFLSYQHFPIYSVMALFLGAFLIVLFGRSKFLRNLIAFLATAIALGCMIMLIKPVMLEHEIICYWMGNRAMAGGYAMGIAMEVDQVSLFFGLLISTAVFVACVYSLQYMEHDDNKPQYYTLFLMLAGGVMGLVLSGDLFNMFIMVEILTFAAVALTAFRNKAFGALEAAFKYLVVGCMGSTCILAGTIMLYAQAHTLNFAQLSSITRRLRAALHRLFHESLHRPVPPPGRRRARRGPGFHLGADLGRSDQERRLRHPETDLLPVPDDAARLDPVHAGLRRLGQHVRLRHDGPCPA